MHLFFEIFFHKTYVACFKHPDENFVQLCVPIQKHSLDFSRYQFHIINEKPKNILILFLFEWMMENYE